MPKPDPTPFPSPELPPASVTDTSDTAMLHGQVAQLQMQLTLTARSKAVFQKKYTETINQNLGLEERIMELEEELAILRALHSPETPKT